MFQWQRQVDRQAMVAQMVLYKRWAQGPDESIVGLSNPGLEVESSVEKAGIFGDIWS